MSMGEKMNSSGILASKIMNSNNEELRREFEQNYRRYLDNVYLFNRINEILLNSELSLRDKETVVVVGGGGSVDAQKLRQQFLKAINIASNHPTTTNTLDSAVLANKSRLTDEAKSFLREKIGQHVEKELADINLILHSDDVDSNERSDKELDLVTVKLRELMSTIEEMEKRCQIAKSDYDIKLEHCVKLAAEMTIILRRMLDEFKLSFYDKKNRASCEQLLIEIELFFVKTELTVYELVDDLYGTSDKQHTLAIIRNHLDAVSERTRDSLSRAQTQLDAYKSLGKDFQHIVDQYSNLKKDLEFKRAHLKRLKDDMTF